MSHNFVPLDLSGDLFRPYQYDEAGNIMPRKDTVDVSNAPQFTARSKDVAAILASELAEARAQLDSK